MPWHCNTLRLVQRDSLTAVRTEKSVCASLQWWWPLRLGRPGLRSWKSLVFMERGLRSGTAESVPI